MVSTALSLAFFLALSGTAAISGQSGAVPEVVQAVSRNVKEFQDLLPDFVCKETITSSTSRSGKVRKQTTVESIFTAVQKPSIGPNFRRAAFTETRDVTAIDGKPVRKGTRMPRLPVQFTGGFSSVLIMTFSPENLPFHRYNLDGLTKDGGPQLVRFVTQDDQTAIKTLFDGEVLADRDSGNALIDTSAGQVIRIEREFLNLPRRLSHLENFVDYGPVRIGGRDFWLPRTILTEGAERDARNTERYIAAYSDCKRFVADIRIVQ
jgi:hypothetical protein